MGYRVQSELESGCGRSDLIVCDPARNRCLLLELKHVQGEADMDEATGEASSQIIRKKYASRLVYDGYTTRRGYAMAFYRKRSLIAEARDC